jgi:hypothetical protein
MRSGGVQGWDLSSAIKMVTLRLSDEAQMTETTVTLEFLARLCQQTLQEARALRKDVADVRSLSLTTIEYARRIERRVGEQRDDLEMMLKAELGGSLAHMQTQFENYLQPIHDRMLELDKLDERISALERGV